MGVYCSDCIIEDETICQKCSDNPNYKCLHSQKMLYKPTCPRGYSDCINDPAYIRYCYPDWYRELYKDLTPEQASMKSCQERVKEDPDEMYYCYDDEDK
jgi:hypothetical protein